MARYQYGNRVIDGLTIDINQVPRQLRKKPEWLCNCPVCGDPFSAAMGSRNEPHFRHKNKRLDDVCDVNRVNQTGLHKRAKEVIQEALRFHLPPYIVERDEVDLDGLPPSIIQQLPEQFVYQKDREIRCTKVELEKRISDIVPDVVAYTLEGEYLIEIYVTNPVDDEKIAKAEKIGLPLLQVDLSDLKGEPISEEDLRKYVVEGYERTEWLVFPERDKALEAAKAFFLAHKKVKEYRMWQDKRRLERKTDALRKPVSKKKEEPKPAPKEEPQPAPKAIEPTPINKPFLGGRPIYCWACGQMKNSGEMVMYKSDTDRGLCHECHYDKGVPPAWK